MHAYILCRAAEPYPPTHSKGNFLPHNAKPQPNHTDGGRGGGNAAPSVFSYIYICVYIYALVASAKNTSDSHMSVQATWRITGLSQDVNTQTGVITAKYIISYVI